MRDDEQHRFTVVEKGLLDLHVRAAFTLFDDLLHRAFGDRLAGHLPVRVLPIGSEPPQAFQTLVARNTPTSPPCLNHTGRARAEAAARTRALLAMEPHISLIDLGHAPIRIRTSIPEDWTHEACLGDTP
jgi:hypothetical protein